MRKGCCARFGFWKKTACTCEILPHLVFPAPTLAGGPGFVVELGCPVLRFRKGGAFDLILTPCISAWDSSSVPITALIAARGAARTTQGPSPHAASANIDLDPVGERQTNTKGSATR